VSDLALVHLVCVDERHLLVGRSRPDGSGYFTVSPKREWAYCSAALEDEPHVWAETGGVAPKDLGHADLGRFRSH
jgi:hypothetical protein